VLIVVNVVFGCFDDGNGCCCLVVVLIEEGRSFDLSNCFLAYV
jgi:hypothetical protein